MNRKKIAGIVIACVVVILVGIGIYLFVSGDDGRDLPFYEAGSYEELKSILNDADDTFLLPDEQIMLSDYSYGFYQILLNEPNGVPNGYYLVGLDKPGDDYHMTVTIRCTRIIGEVEGAELLEACEGIEIITDGYGKVIFEMYGYRYFIESDISSEKGGLQGEEVELPEGLRIAKHMIDHSLLME